MSRGPWRPSGWMPVAPEVMDDEPVTADHAGRALLTDRQFEELLLLIRTYSIDANMMGELLGRYRDDFPAMCQALGLVECAASFTGLCYVLDHLRDALKRGQRLR